MTTSTTTAATAATDEAAVTYSCQFQGRACPGAYDRCSVVLDPEDRTVTFYQSVGSGVPARIWHGRAVSFSVPPNASLEAVEQALRDNEFQILAAFDAYEGYAWNGHNLVGVWTDEEARNAAVECLQEACSQVPAYWDAAEWLAPVERDVAEYVADRVRQGMSPGEAIAEVASNEVEGALGAGEGAILENYETVEAVAYIYMRRVERLIDGADLLTSGLVARDANSVLAWIGEDPALVPCAVAALCLDEGALAAAAEEYFAS